MNSSSPPPVDPATNLAALPADMFELITRALNAAYYEWPDGSTVAITSAALNALFGFEDMIWTGNA